MKNTFFEKIDPLWKEKKFLCIGLDPVFEKLPRHLKKFPLEKAILAFNTEIIDATAEFVCSYKPNAAFYEQYGIAGWKILTKTIQYIQKNYPQIPIIFDAKRADIGNTNIGYVISAFDELKVDAVTVHPYLGQEALEPYLSQNDKLILVLVKTSNSGSGEFQNLHVDPETRLYEFIAKQVAKKWNRQKNCGVVVGATYPQELKRVRRIIGDIPMLIPGIGAQGGDLHKTIESSVTEKKDGIIVSSSRDILYASDRNDFAEKAHNKAKNVYRSILSIV